MATYAITFDDLTGVCEDTSVAIIPDTLRGHLRKAGMVLGPGERKGEYLDGASNSVSRAAAVNAFLVAGHTLNLTAQ